MDEAEFNEEEGGFSEHHSLLCSATSDVLSLALFRIFFSVTILAFPWTFCFLYCCFSCKVSHSLLLSFAQKHLCHTNICICDSNLKGHHFCPRTSVASLDLTSLDGSVALIMFLDKEALLHFTFALNCFSIA